MNNVVAKNTNASQEAFIPMEKFDKENK